VYAATLAMLPPGGLWIVDIGNKRIQVEALLASEGRLYSVFSPVFPALSALPFRVIDDEGLGFFSLRLEPHALAGR